MKKVIIACAAVLALGLTSCGDTNYCYEVKQTFKLLGVESTLTSHVWTTKNEIKAYEADLKAAGEKAGYTDFKITSTIMLGVSKEDCK
ncbi:MAG: hypothetical protein J5823_04855 [Paludibacteraceae bacterium]|nr:hypothetical protein [Paludibacteraceae bacterium]